MTEAGGCLKSLQALIVIRKIPRISATETDSNRNTGGSVAESARSHMESRTVTAGFNMFRDFLIMQT